ncbi:MAG: hypothetical protein M3R57_10545, partial [Chloroflexota bacterium]|nr:hypothetical protein [Chloroflexota bacterium]
MPPVVKVDAEPVAATAPPQAASVKSRTVVPASTVPTTFGVVSLEGETGSERVSPGVAGAVVSIVTVRDDERA